MSEALPRLFGMQEVQPPAPLADLPVDEEWQAARLVWLAELDAEHERLVDVSHGASAEEHSDAADDSELPWSVMAGVAHDVALDRLEAIARSARVATAEQYRVIADILRDAADVPEPWVGPDPTQDPVWVDPRNRSAATIRRERRRFAVRAAVADIAIRLCLADTTIRTRAAHADTLQRRCPRVWAAFTAGDIDERNAQTVAEFADSLPHDGADSWAAFDAEAVAAARMLTPMKFRVTARAARERIHAESIDVRARRAAEKRGVWIGPELDGMATLTAHLPAVDAYAAKGRLDAIAANLRGGEGETRTLNQLRADAFSDLLTTGTTETSNKGERSGRGRAAVAITVPVLRLLDQSEQPATLEGYGPIDSATAKRLAGSASSWVRILTHPVTGVVLDMDRKTYRVPKDLRRWVEMQHPTCTRPGCNRSARDCDMDHIIDWQYGGKTSADNLGPGCEPDHRLRHNSCWDVHVDPDTGEIYWTSPTGRVTVADDTPF
jgi:hypothetical protein